MAEVSSQIAVERDFAALRSTDASARLTRSFSAAIRASIFLAFMWSIYFWVTNV
jgi:hypothetical protein